MSYKPTTGTSIIDNDFRLATSEGVYEALLLKQDALPSQSGNADKVLVSDGSALSWQYAGLGSGSFGTEVAILGRGKPVSMTGTNSTLVGVGAGNALTSGLSNNCVGAWTGSAITVGSNNNMFGQRAGRFATGSANTYIGHTAGHGVSGQTTGNNNTGVGNSTLFRITSGYDNTTIGRGSGNFVTTGNTNTFIGNLAGTAVTTGSNNTIIGSGAGSTTLASTIIVGAGTAERFRVDSSGNMGIGTSTPSARLDVNGDIKATSGDVIIDTVGKGLKVKTGTNAKMGTASFANVSSVTVNTTAALSSSLIFVTQQDGGSEFGVTNKANGSFDITHAGGNITAVVAWLIIDPA